MHYSELPALPLARYRHAPDVDNSKKHIPPARIEPLAERLFNQKIATTTTVFEESEADSDGSESLEVDTKPDAPANAVGGTTTTKTMWVWPPEGTPQQKQLYGGVTANFHNSEMLMHLEEHLQVWLLRFLAIYLTAWIILLFFVVVG